jgi:hypothetical protein
MHYQWECSAKLAREMLTAIQPYVVTKKQRVDLALEAEALRMAASRRVGITGTGSAIGEEVHTRLVEISAAIRALNMKGPKALPKGPDGLSLKVSRTLHKLAR